MVKRQTGKTETNFFSAELNVKLIFWFYDGKDNYTQPQFPKSRKSKRRFHRQRKKSRC